MSFARVSASFKGMGTGSLLRQKSNYFPFGKIPFRSRSTKHASAVSSLTGTRKARPTMGEVLRVTVEVNEQK